MWSWWDCIQWWDGASRVGSWDGSMQWLMFLPMLWPLVIIGAIVLIVMLLMRSGRTETARMWRTDGRRQTPFEILSERFARGEIDRQEFEERRGLLSES